MNLEDYEERFQLSYKRARCTLDPESLKLVLLRGVREDILDTLHMLEEEISINYPMTTSRLSLETILGQLKNKGRSSNLWLVHRSPTHPSRVKSEICWRTSKLRCCKPLPYNWIPWISEENKRKQREPWPSFVLGAPEGILGMNVH